MKKTLFLFLFALGGIYAMAQEPYYCTMKGAVLNYTDYGAKGNENGQTIHTFKEVTGKDGNFDITMDSTVNAAGVVNTTEVKVQIRNGSAQIGMGNGSIDVTVSDPVLFEIPNKLAVWMQLPLGEAIANIGGFRVKSTITENEVMNEDQEQLEAEEQATKEKNSGKKSKSSTDYTAINAERKAANAKLKYDDWDY
ncbi:MAG: hypothetical protein IJQ11_14295 [Bacteroidales bacterium]|nr:hypothetical protein [Bacteroidales bacterium]